MNIKYNRAKPKFSKSDIENIMPKVESILNSVMLLQGKYVSEFEFEFAKKVGSKYAIATNSCTSALEIAIKSLNIKDKKILVPTQTFVATGNSVVLSGNTPVFTDIDEETLCMSFDSIKQNVDDETAAIVIVHMGGLITPDYYKIRSFCKERDIFIIEDAAHAHGASIDGVMAGNLGDVGCFSFYATKIMTSGGEGGMITTNNLKVYERSRLLRSHGGDGRLFYEHSSNYRMTELQAVIGLSQLKRLDEFVEKRNFIADRYINYLDGVGGIQLMDTYDNIYNSYWNFYFILDSNLNRDIVMRELTKFGIQSGDAYSPSCNNQPVFNKYISNLEFKVADNILKRHISLPMYVDLNENDIKFITDKLKDIINDYKR